ncbi:XRE family transcriptional regulator [Streptacidiphilus pinicola]|uniref:XRE family transcriptional regulator n=1 Tax=Streptacidiphilus pinicola TaxID=2219663 RepID=A0A2X0IDB9_9ACTN|nr:helix-turn-helix domain-containing protein [Streptacidiphilus pinicola]RAG82517.1 XRE family transcriptional regulator [Streptacidiphilus pinicola]
MTERLGPLLRGLRNQAGLTQEELAHESGVSVSTIRRLETGRLKDHRLGTVNLLADALNASPEERRRLAATLTGVRQRDDEPELGAPVAPAEPVAPTEPATTAEQPPEPIGPAVAPARTPVPAPAPLRGELADAAEELAREVRRRLQREEEQRRVHDPFALPVRWQAAPPGLADHRANVERLTSGGVPAEGDGPPAAPLEGDLRGVAESYRAIRSGRLVILGRAGSGKSILTIRLALDLLEPPGFPDRVPVVFSLGSWDPTTTTLRDWMVDLLLRDHPHLARRVPSGASMAAALVQGDVILPVLDGFDEIAEGLRAAALEELNTALLPLVLTSRRAEFAEAAQAAGSPLVLAAAIELTDLTVDHVVDYLPRTARPAALDALAGAADRDGASPPLWHEVLEALRARRTRAATTLAAVLSTPLMVTLARTMYSDGRHRDPTELLDEQRFPTAHALEEHLLAGFVPALYRRRTAERPTGGRARRREWDAERAQRWLGYLAHHMVGGEREQQDLAWWRIGDSLPRALRVLAVVLVSTVSMILADWLVGLLTSSAALWFVMLDGLLMGPVVGVSFGLLYAVLVVRSDQPFEPARMQLRLSRRNLAAHRGPVRLTPRRLSAVLLGGFAMGAGTAAAITVERGLYLNVPLDNWAVVRATLVNMLAFGLIFGIAAGLTLALMATLEAPLDTSAAATPIGLLAANRATVSRQLLVLGPVLALAITFGGFAVCDVLQYAFGPMTWGLTVGLIVGTIGGLGGACSCAIAFTAWGQWLVLTRLWLPLTGRLPWNTIAFLDDAYRRGVLRQTGAVYQFRHLRLQHHLGHSFREQHRRRYAPARFAAPGTEG